MFCLFGVKLKRSFITFVFITHYTFKRFLTHIFFFYVQSISLFYDTGNIYRIKCTFYKTTALNTRTPFIGSSCTDTRTTSTLVIRNRKIGMLWVWNMKASKFNFRECKRERQRDRESDDIMHFIRIMKSMQRPLSRNYCRQLKWHFLKMYCAFISSILYFCYTYLFLKSFHIFLNEFKRVMPCVISLYLDIVLSAQLVARGYFDRTETFGRTE